MLHLQLISRLPADTRNALLEPLIAQERKEDPESLKFGQAEEFGHLMVPEDYVQSKFIDETRARYREQKGVVVLDNWNGAWFTLSSHELRPGERITVTAVRQYAKAATLGEQLQYLDTQGAVYPSTHGLLLFFDQFRSEMTMNTWYVALDAESRLPMMQHQRCVLMARRELRRSVLKVQSVAHVGPDVRILCFRQGF
ncbi:MAG TPA: hypothetical protein VFS75_01315 [Candidatus Paceibacterota bacterium]|nr:hypothetical protein [Candidatus Paceibacterota bacterium]